MRCLSEFACFGEGVPLTGIFAISLHPSCTFSSTSKKQETLHAAAASNWNCTTRRPGSRVLGTSFRLACATREGKKAKGGRGEHVSGRAEAGREGNRQDTSRLASR